MPSSVVAWFGYDALMKVLKVRYVSGAIYEYMGVPEDIYEEMRRSKSKGIYLNKNIKPYYDYRKVEDAA